MNGICPLCGQKNLCAFSLGQDPETCWCMTAEVPKELLSQVPDEKRGKSCICQSCIEKYKSELENSR
ncbi:hypothetical protein J2Z35_002235 [Acetoanaerobium pronyense]|uniref:Cysteine-rich CWC n=1 Tax=Acetoanaerobium pronyense TaxID=1482736 RepID=A0ABS4KKZ7_9FIRM|nr:cysteine-rich CWC family protein [Acetoanaerobium pronyense]MBP2028434.1 hypothetical protein [Acetoanaerobium pronyense]